MDNARKFSLFQKCTVVITCAVVFSALSGCSYLQRKPKSVGEAQLRGDEQKYVARSKYDKLLHKYEQLFKKYEKLSYQQVPRDGEERKEKGAEVDRALSKMKMELDRLGGKKKRSPASKDKFALRKKQKNVIYLQSEKFRRSLSLLKQKKYSKSMEILQMLEGSEFAQMQVRSKFYIGKLLHLQGEFDLSLQVFEDILQNYPFSSFALKSVKQAYLCSKELGIIEKISKYKKLVNEYRI